MPRERRRALDREPVTRRLAAPAASEVMYGGVLPRREAARVPPCGGAWPAWAQYAPRPRAAPVGPRVYAWGTTGRRCLFGDALRDAGEVFGRRLALELRERAPW